MTNEQENIYFDMLVEHGVATAAELCLVFDVTPLSWIETMNAVCYARTGYRSVKQWVREEVEVNE